MFDIDAPPLDVRVAKVRLDLSRRAPRVLTCCPNGQLTFSHTRIVNLLPLEQICYSTNAHTHSCLCGEDSNKNFGYPEVHCFRGAESALH